MKGMSLGKGVWDFCSSSSSLCSPDCLPHLKYQVKWQTRFDDREDSCGYVIEPRSVLEVSRRPSPPTSSSAGGSAASTETAGLAAAPPVAACSSVNPSPPHAEKCGYSHPPQNIGTEEWKNLLPFGGNVGGSSSPCQEQSILRLIMADMEDPYKLAPHPHLEFNNAGYFGMGDHVLNLDEIMSFSTGNLSSPEFLPPGRIGSVVNQFPLPLSYPQLQQHHDPAVFLPLPFPQVQTVQDTHHLLSPPPAKRIHSMTAKHKHREGDEMGSRFGNGNGQQVQVREIINPICHAAELIESGEPVHAQGILARLNHQLSLPVGKPPQRAAFYFKEALQLLLQLINSNSLSSNLTASSSYNLIFKIGAYKSLTEISPILQFSNFTSNQALLEVFEGYNKIHIVDFDLSYGGQWASLMQELAARGGGCPSLRITAFASSSHDELELRFTKENLKLFARDLNMPFELEILNLESLSAGTWPVLSDNGIVAVNLANLSLPAVLRFVKQLSPKIVVWLDRGCNRNDLPFGHHVNQAIQSYSLLLESLDAINMSPESLQKIERFWVQPGIEKIVLGRHSSPDRIPSWRSLFLQYGFTPLSFSSVTESQAECLVQRCPVRGFHVERRQSSLVLCWQRKELVTASAWKC